MDAPTIDSTLVIYLDTVTRARSEHTARAYTNAANTFRAALRKNGVDPSETPIDKLSEDAISWIVTYLKDHSPATERLYVQVIAGYYEYIAAERLADINMPRLRIFLRQRARRARVCPPEFPAQDIRRVLEFVVEPSFIDGLGEHERLRALRDRAFILALADTGLRIHEACKLCRGDVDWHEAHAIIRGNSDKRVIVRFSTRALDALRDYLAACAALDACSGKLLATLPLFIRHDKGAGNKIKKMATRTGQNIVHERVEQALGRAASSSITPHTFRHYFVTTVLRASGDLKVAQELARHANIQVTQRYAHLSNDELDKGYHEIFNRKPESE